MNAERVPDAAASRLCKFCKERPATLHFGDALSFTHGGGLNCCDLCCAEKQLAHAKQQATLVPEREAEVARLRKELDA